MMGKEDYSYEEIEKAKEVTRRFGNIPIREMEYRDQIELVKMHYSYIRGVSIGELPEKQLYRIAKRLYYKAHKVSQQYTPFEKMILGKISKLKSTLDSEKKFALEERISIQLESSKNNFLKKALERVIIG